MPASLTVSRRVLLINALAAAVTSGIGGGNRASAQGAVQAATLVPRPKLRFFTAKEYDILDTVAELIVPATDRSGGARAAGVPQYIDAMLGEMLDERERKSWRDDLAEIDRLAGEWFKRPFLKLSGEQKADLLTRISGNEAQPKEAGEYAFGTIKWIVTEAYYRSRVGIHDELGYLGNVSIDEFVGTDVSRP